MILSNQILFKFACILNISIAYNSSLSQTFFLSELSYESLKVFVSYTDNSLGWDNVE